MSRRSLRTLLKKLLAEPNTPVAKLLAEPNTPVAKLLIPPTILESKLATMSHQSFHLHREQLVRGGINCNP